MIYPAVKICCISSLEEASLAIQYGASAIGLVSEMPSGPGVIPEEMIKTIAANTPSHIETFLLTSRQDVDEIVDQHRRLRTSTIQIVDDLSRGTCSDLRRALPGVRLVQVIHVRDEESIEKANRVAAMVDAILLDSGNQEKVVKELGGTGRTHNWSLSRQIVNEVSVPVYLAGGLRAENVVNAVNQVGPYGLDLCSGVRTNGRLDETKLSVFFSQLEAAEIFHPRSDTKVHEGD